MDASETDTTDHSGPVDLSQRFLRAVKSGEETEPIRRRIAEIDSADLDALDAAERLAFWLNAYNAATQDALRSQPERFENRQQFFSEPILTVAGAELSLDDIEHGILRRSQWKYGLGYVTNPFPSAFIRRHRVADPDLRIHFALNCGAAACPAIAAYTADAVDEQLDHAAESYLGSETLVEDETVRVPRLMLWYRGDFGGGSGIRRLLSEYDVIEPGASPRIRYREYDWSLALDAFRDDGESN